jgi:Uncharacterized protein conserved in bacteria (DUF2242)
MNLQKPQKRSMREVASGSMLKSGKGSIAAFAKASAVAALGAALVSACTMGQSKYHPEEFGSTTTYSRNYPSTPATTCEAARRALLSQGFVITVSDADHVNGRKNLQPEPDMHMEIEFHVVCAPDGKQGDKTIAFVNALQDRYALKKSNNSASVGVGAIGSLSLPFTSSDDSLVRVSSETITAGAFYEKFFVLLKRYLAADQTTDADAPSAAASGSAAASSVAR